MRSHGKDNRSLLMAKSKQREMLMPEENKRPDESQPERRRRIIELQYDAYTRVIEFRIFVLRPDGERARALGGGAFEEQDLERVAEELIKLADDFAYHAAQVEGFFQEIEEDGGEDV
jgi:hypothetical protein